LLTGRLIDDGGGASALLRVEAVPPALATAIIKATRDDPDERFQDATELGEALTYVARVGQRQQTLRSIPPLSRPPVPTPAAVNRAVRALGVFALLVAVGLFGYVTCDVLSQTESSARRHPG
jgi:hypothetical protein